jgi:glycosyltransferase involved in cell wall biosynthesis
MDDLEVIAVDDGSADARAVAQVVAASRRARLLRCERSMGPAAARNRGARLADADVVLFTDDDCEPAPDWASCMRAAIKGGADAVAGITVNGRPADALASASETILAYVQERARHNGATNFAATNNIAVSGGVLADVAFDETYRYGEDRDWCARIVAAGYSLTVEPSAVVVHSQNLSLSTFVRQQFGYGRGAGRFRLRHAAFRRLESPGFYGGLLGRGFEQGVAPGVLVAVAQAATAVGFVYESLSREQRRPA